MYRGWQVGYSAALFSLLAACSGSDGGSGGSGGSAGGGGTQDGWWCVCNSGLSVGLDASVSSEQVQTVCAEQCADQGGLERVQPKLTALGTPECTAFCAKADQLDCPGSSCAENADFWCQVGPDSCVEAKRAELQCRADNGVYECTENGWQRSSSGCSNFDELCSP
jgi:hypothetical protein